ncbi:MAG: purine-nucleoside phosphorylase [Clostridiales bacterium]|nr:purine-nucleoside phosphorylase [Clostridiales bacterium]
MDDKKTPAVYDDYRRSADFISERISAVDTAIILGSGLDGFAEAISGRIVIPYADIPGFPVSTVSYQKGELIYGSVNGRPVLAMNGRFHYYEGWEMWQCAYPVGVFKLLGIDKIIITNAAGGIDPSYAPGDLVIVRDHIKLVPDSPARGGNIPEFGARFFDMQKVYSDRLASYALGSAVEAGTEVRDGGVYGFMAGPQYETPSEIKALRILGATVVGMSTVPEVIQAAHCGMEALVLSCVTNMAAGVSDSVPDENEVVNVGRTVSSKLKSIVCGVISRL